MEILHIISIKKQIPMSTITIKPGILLVTVFSIHHNSTFNNYRWKKKNKKKKTKKTKKKKKKKERL